MSRRDETNSPRPKELSDHYASGYESTRLESGQGMIDRERTRELLERFLPAAPATIADIGGGTGAHACWLAQQGYEVHLIDIVPLHVELARRASAQQPDFPLASAEVGDACSLLWEDARFDAVMLFGPLYHLTNKRDRAKALSEAYRVLKANGVLLTVGISRFASTLDGLCSGFLKDPVFIEIVDGDLADGHHRNPTGNPNYFMDTFFHHPDELRSEVSEAGFEVNGVFGVEGPSWLAPDVDDWWKDEDSRNVLLRITRALETEQSLLGISAHLIAVARKI